VYRFACMYRRRKYNRYSCFSHCIAVKTCRFEHAIAGRTYVIEVSPVSSTRWRAQMARLPGMPTSVMPFYGVTPEEAARALTAWLSLVSTPPALSATGARAGR
jgi:hypothetical protein